MSTKPLMLDGLVKTDSEKDDGLLRQWRKEKQQLEEELLSVRRELDDANRERERLERTVRNLRQQLSPLHRALRAVFGEIELAVGEEEFREVGVASAGAAASGNDPRWQSFKNTFPGAPARVIDALLAHEEMTITQLSTVLKAHYDTVKAALAKLRKAGAVVSNGGKHRLAS